VLFDTEGNLHDPVSGIKWPSGSWEGIYNFQPGARTFTKNEARQEVSGRGGHLGPWHDTQTDYDRFGKKASAIPELAVKQYEGTEGNNNHITRNEMGMIPLDWVRNMPGARRELPGEHRNYEGDEWDEFKNHVAAGTPGYNSPIFITVDHGGQPMINEGNHRRDAYAELGATHVPAEIRYFGHAERQGTVGDRAGMQREAVFQVEAMPYNPDYINGLRFELHETDPVTPGVHKVVAIGPDGEPHGSVRWWKDKIGMYPGEVSNIWVHPDYRRQGLAYELLRRAKDATTEKGWTPMTHDPEPSDEGEAMIRGLGDEPGGHVLQHEGAAIPDETGLKAAGIAVIAMDTGRVLMQQRALNPLMCPCGMGVTWDDMNGYQHDDGSVSHDGEFYGQSVSDLLDQGHPEEDDDEGLQSEANWFEERKPAILVPGDSGEHEIGYRQDDEDDEDPMWSRIVDPDHIDFGNPSGDEFMALKPMSDSGQSHNYLPSKGEMCEDCYMYRGDRYPHDAEHFEEHGHKPMEAPRYVASADGLDTLGLDKTAALEFDPNEGRWEFPGGKLDPGESARTAAIREFREEVGQDLPPGVFVGAWISPGGITVAAAVDPDYQREFYDWADREVGYSPNEIEADPKLKRELADGFGHYIGEDHPRDARYHLDAGGAGIQKVRTGTPGRSVRVLRVEKPDGSGPFAYGGSTIPRPFGATSADDLDLYRLLNPKDIHEDEDPDAGSVKQRQPYADGIPARYVRGRSFGFLPQHDVHSYFTPQMLRGLHERGFGMSEYDVPGESLVLGRTQVAWKPEDATLVSHTPLDKFRGRTAMVQPGDETYGYGSGHTAPVRGEPGNRNTLDNMDDMMPDYLEHPEWYGNGGGDAEWEAHSKAVNARGKPDKSVRIYRAVPHGISKIYGNTELSHMLPEQDPNNLSEWVSTSKKYAQEHALAESCPKCGGHMQVISGIARAGDLVNEGYPTEFGYVGDKTLEHTGSNRIYKTKCPEPKRVPKTNEQLEAEYDVVKHQGQAAVEQWEKDNEADRMYRLRPRRSMVAPDGSFYHGTIYPHVPGDEIDPKNSRKYFSDEFGGPEPWGTPVQRVFFTKDQTAAARYGEAPGGLFLVEPTGPYFEHPWEKGTLVSAHPLKIVERIEPKLGKVAKAPVYKGFIYLIQRESDIDLGNREHANPDDPDGDMTEQSAWWDIEHARKNPALRKECKKGTPWDELEMWADQSVRSNKEIKEAFAKLAALPPDNDSQAWRDQFDALTDPLAEEGHGQDADMWQRARETMDDPEAPTERKDTARKLNDAYSEVDRRVQRAGKWGQDNPGRVALFESNGFKFRPESGRVRFDKTDDNGWSHAIEPDARGHGDGSYGPGEDGDGVGWRVAANHPQSFHGLGSDLLPVGGGKSKTLLARTGYGPDDDELALQLHGHNVQHSDFLSNGWTPLRGREYQKTGPDGTKHVAFPQSRTEAVPGYSPIIYDTGKWNVNSTAYGSPHDRVGQTTGAQHPSHLDAIMAHQEAGPQVHREAAVSDPFEKARAGDESQLPTTEDRVRRGDLAAGENWWEYERGMQHDAAERPPSRETYPQIRDMISKGRPELGVRMGDQVPVEHHDAVVGSSHPVYHEDPDQSQPRVYALRNNQFHTFLAPVTYTQTGEDGWLRGSTKTEPSRWRFYQEHQLGDAVAGRAPQPQPAAERYVRQRATGKPLPPEVSDPTWREGDVPLDEEGHQEVEPKRDTWNDLGILRGYAEEPRHQDPDKPWADLSWDEEPAFVSKNPEDRLPWWSVR
jgi:GNAT superfamily N-acetyltransferase